MASLHTRQVHADAYNRVIVTARNPWHESQMLDLMIKLEDRMKKSPMQMLDDLEEWDVRRSLFDDHMAESMQSNLEYMWKKFGFYFPEADLLTHPEGLLKYLVSICLGKS